MKLIQSYLLSALTVAVLIFAFTQLTSSRQAVAQTSGVPDKSPCDALKSKTYIAYVAGKFDSYPDAAGAARTVFDASGKGAVRSFLGYRPSDANAVQQNLTCTCGVLPDGKAYLKYIVGAGTDAGTNFITSFDNGARIWVESGTPGRPMKGWMLQQPPAQR
ncbi:MAG: hypothetical protein JNK38_13415 [Acidobacteria bacterium]|nr:hypothetical protein [Acidobacteriota bacterium]